MNILIINLPGVIERRTFQEEQLCLLDLDYQIVPATTIDDIDEETYQKHYYDWQRPMRKTEVACYFSHQKLWHQIIQDNKPALILEDDALLSKHLPFLLPQVENRNDMDMLNLEVRGRKKFISKTFETIGNHKLYQLLQDRTGAAAYVLYPSGAKKLIECQQQNGIALADAHITACNNLHAYQIEPALAIQLDQCSHYGINHTYLEKISTSTINSNSRCKGNFYFRTKRVFNQVKLGFRQLMLITKSQRRYITIDNKSFLQKR